MNQQNLFNTKPVCFGQVVPREYQSRDLEKSFELWDGGKCGVLTRAFTGSGKTLMACMKFDRWLQRSPQHRCMVISYEKQLVWQFAQEINDVLGMQPGIEMEAERVEPSFIPPVVVASRQTLMLKKPADDKQKEALAAYDINEIGQLTHIQAKRSLRLLDEGMERDAAIDLIIDLNRNYQCNERGVSRLWKFDANEYVWLVAWDEGHKHAYHLKTVQHIVDWFDQNPENKRNGLTATPKRSDKVSIGDKMFSGVSLDYPLWSLDDECAVKEGYAVPYKQRFVEVESIDFKAFKEESGGNQEKWDRLVDKALEKELAAVVEPLLDMCEERRTLIFSPSVSMAKNVAAYINARTPCHCKGCNKVAWYSWLRIADGAECVSCAKPIGKDNTLRGADQAESLDGKIPAEVRCEVYRRHQTGKFQFLSVCGLCREGYNDPDISCVAVFRPVSKAASSLAEQMKGRGSRVRKGTIDGLATAEERLEAIAASDKLDCLIVDLVGITNLADCASTIQIYAEGLPDEVRDKAEELLLAGTTDPAEAIEAAKEEIDREKVRLRKEREEQERRAEAARRSAYEARANYTTREVGVATNVPGMATDKQLKFIKHLGMEFDNWEPSGRQAGRIITQLKGGMDVKEVAYKNRLQDGEWTQSKASEKQRYYLLRNKIPHNEGVSPLEASNLIERHKAGGYSVADLYGQIEAAESNDELSTVWINIKQSKLDPEELAGAISAGKNKRTMLKEYGGW